MTFMMITQLLVVLIALWVGARYGSLALGAISGIGLAVLVFAFHLKPGTPPTEVIYIIIAAVTCAGVLQASGGMDWMIQIAEKLLRKHPDRITLMAPFVTFFLTVLVGTHRPRDLYAHAHHLRHCAEKGHPAGTALQHCQHLLADRHHLFAHCRGRSGLFRHFRGKRL